MKDKKTLVIPTLFLLFLLPFSPAMLLACCGSKVVAAY